MCAGSTARMSSETQAAAWTKNKLLLSIQVTYIAPSACASFRFPFVWNDSKHRSRIHHPGSPFREENSVFAFCVLFCHQLHVSLSVKPDITSRHKSLFFSATIVYPISLWEVSQWNACFEKVLVCSFSSILDVFGYPCTDARKQCAKKICTYSVNYVSLSFRLKSANIFCISSSKQALHLNAHIKYRNVYFRVNEILERESNDAYLSSRNRNMWLILYLHLIISIIPAVGVRSWKKLNETLESRVCHYFLDIQINSLTVWLAPQSRFPFAFSSSVTRFYSLRVSIPRHRLSVRRNTWSELKRQTHRHGLCFGGVCDCQHGRMVKQHTANVPRFDRGGLCPGITPSTQRVLPDYQSSNNYAITYHQKTHRKIKVSLEEPFD